jgi:catechol 2,3-dioxygenase-like lactoylglutathione lyase family enzyme
MIEIDAMFPVMVTAKLDAVKVFYESVFGFNTVFYDDSFYLHLVSPSGIQLGFLLPEHGSQPDFLRPLMSPDGYVISLEVKDATRAYAEAQKNGFNDCDGVQRRSLGAGTFYAKRSRRFPNRRGSTSRSFR